MSRSVRPARNKTALPEAFARRDRWGRNLLARRLERLRWGHVRLIDSQGSIEAGANTGPRVEVEVRCPRFYSQVAFGGTIGAAEAYMAGMWQCDDLPGLIGILARNSDILQRVEGGWALPARPARKILHWMNRNSLRGSRRNIAAHYDLGNDFYRLFLDESLTYSSALFREPGMSLAQAQQAKIDRLCRLLRLSKNNHLLEIGTGWGALAIHAAKHYGSRVTTATISRQQFEYASKRVEEEGLSDRIKLEFQDYRRLRGKYDRIVSVEMIEAVGHRNVPRYFRKLGQLSTDDALVALQAITVPDQLYRKHVRRVDFIKRYIFPGSCLTSVGAMCRAAAKQTRLRPVDLADLTEHYARTLEIWRLSLRENWQAAGRLGLSQEFLRMWEFYFAYCQGAFAQRYIGDVQILFSGPLCRVESICSRP